MGKAKTQVVPYRDSNLTRILQNALGGNSKTIMICAISPSNMNYEESLSTLRYADRAKKIQNKAVINESAQDKLIRELKQENEQLKKLLLQAAKGDGTINIADLGLGSAEDIVENMNHAEEEIENMDNFEEKLKKEKEASKIHQEEMAIKKKLENPQAPHLTNLNEDPQLSQQIYYSMTDMPVLVGRKNDDPKPKIIFGGISVHKNHGKFTMAENGLITFELTAMDAIDQTLINGERLDPENPFKVLQHLDCIYFGSGAMLLFKYPLQQRALKQIRAEVWESTQGGDDAFKAITDEEVEVLAQ